MVMLAGVLLAVVTAGAADVTGKWEGKVTAEREDGTTSEDSVLLILAEKDGKVTGTVGGSESDQHPITTGAIEGKTLSLVARSGSGREYHVELTIDGDEMKGTVTSGGRRGDVQVRKRGE